MNIEQYKRQLLAKERELMANLDRARSRARGTPDEPARDFGDEAVYLEAKEDELREANADWELLNEVRDALRRIENREFGRCVVDGGPIEEERLQAIPWTRYCVKHARQREMPPQTSAA